MNVSVFMKQTINNRIIRTDKRKLSRKQNCCLDWRQSNYIRLMLQGLWLIYSVTGRVGVRDRELTILHKVILSEVKPLHISYTFEHIRKHTYFSTKWCGQVSHFCKIIFFRNTVPTTIAKPAHTQIWVVCLYHI